VVANLTVDSQVQFYAGLTFEPEIQEETNEYVVPLDKLPGFVNSAEWNLGTTPSSDHGSNRSNCDHFIPSHKLCSLHPTPINPSSPPRIHRVNPPSQLLLSPPMGWNPNPQPRLRHQTSRRILLTISLFYLHNTPPESAWHARTPRLNPLRGKSSPFALAIRWSRSSTRGRECSCRRRHDGGFSKVGAENP